MRKIVSSLFCIFCCVNIFCNEIINHIPENMIGTWVSNFADSKFPLEVAFYDDSTFVMKKEKDYYFIGIYYIYETPSIYDSDRVIKNIEFYTIFTNSFDFGSDKIIRKVEPISHSGTQYLIDDSGKKEKLYVLNNIVFKNKNEIILPKWVTKSNSIEEMRAESKEIFLTSYINMLEEHNQKLQGKNYEREFNNFIIHGDMENFPENINRSEKYILKNSAVREHGFEKYKYDVAYQINIPNEVLQWIDHQNCLLVFKNSYSNGSESDVFWADTSMLNDVYNSHELWWNSGSSSEGTQLFFEYVGQITYLTMNGFEKTVPKIKLFRRSIDYAKDEVFSINDPYFFYEVLNLE